MKQFVLYTYSTPFVKRRANFSPIIGFLRQKARHPNSRAAEKRQITIHFSPIREVINTFHWILHIPTPISKRFAAVFHISPPSFPPFSPGAVEKLPASGGKHRVFFRLRAVYTVCHMKIPEILRRFEQKRLTRFAVYDKINVAGIDPRFGIFFEIPAAFFLICMRQCWNRQTGTFEGRVRERTGSSPVCRTQK